MILGNKTMKLESIKIYHAYFKPNQIYCYNYHKIFAQFLLNHGMMRLLNYFNKFIPFHGMEFTKMSYSAKFLKTQKMKTT